MRRRLLQIALSCALLTGLVGVGVLAWFNSQLPRLDSLKNYQPALITQAWDRHGRLLTEYASQRRIIVQLDEMPKHLRDAFIAAEDDQFYEHFGIDPLGILRAAWKMLVAGRIKQGASTITQQVARSFFLTQQRKFSRKIKEILLALKLERNLSKDEILFLYLNQIYLGRGAYGVGAAAQMYFGVAPRELSLAQSAILAGLPPAPSRYAPHVSPEKARKRQLYVLRRMVDTGRISQEEADRAAAEPVHIIRWEAPSWRAPWVDAALRAWMLERFDENAVMQGGMQIYTTFDLEAVTAAQQAVRQGLEDLDKRRGYRGPLTHLTAAEVPAAVSECAQLVDTLVRRHTYGDVVAVVGPTLELTAPTLPVTEVLTPDDLFEGVVTGLTRTLAWVDFGRGVGRLSGAGMRWAREIDPEKSAGEVIVQRPSERLQVGDRILVRPWAESYVRRFGIRPRDIDDAIEELRELDERGATLVLLLEQEPAAQSALVSVLPQTGELIALVGGYDFSRSQFNRAIQARRQPGSAFKPIVYSAALDNGFSPASILIDTPLVYEDAERQFRWKPKNYEGKFYGPMTLVDALTYSRNVVTIQLVQKLGIATIKERARTLGITSPLPDDLSMALGSGVVTPIELIRPYATFANSGRRPEVEFVRDIWDAAGNRVYSYLPPTSAATVNPYDPFEATPPPGNRDVPFGLLEVPPLASLPLTAFPEAISPETAYQMTFLLRNVVERGTGWRARALGRPAAGKTGTTDDNIDSWFVGFTADYASAVWVGFDQLRPLGKYETGSRAASPIWVQYMAAVHKGLPVRDFAVPDSITFREIDLKTGRPASPWSRNKTLLMPFRQDQLDALLEQADDQGKARDPQQWFDDPTTLMQRPGAW